MRLPLLIVALSAIAGCVTPMPPMDPQQAWIDMTTTTGKLVMADKLDGKRLDDGRFFQVTPGSHELQMRYDYELHVGTFGMFNNDDAEITCFIKVKYDHFAPGQRYRLEARSIVNSVSARLYDAGHKVVAEENDVSCLP